MNPFLLRTLWSPFCEGESLSFFSFFYSGGPEGNFGTARQGNVPEISKSVKDSVFCLKKLAEFMGYPFSLEEEVAGAVERVVVYGIPHGRLY